MDAYRHARLSPMPGIILHVGGPVVILEPRRPVTANLRNPL